MEEENRNTGLRCTIKLRISGTRGGIFSSSALSFMLLTQKLMATKEGTQRMEWVYAAMWQRLPKWIMSFMNEKTLREKLQEGYDLAKDMLNSD